ncbi:unnamed protein product [Absidia cylindrospora]
MNNVPNKDTFIATCLNNETQPPLSPKVIDSSLENDKNVMPQVISASSAPSQPNRTAKKFLYQSPNIKFDEKLYVKACIASLVYWEYPRRSISYLGVSLGVLILTQYYSLLQIFAGFLTLAIGANWIYVNTHKQTQMIISGKSAEDIKHPHTERLQSKDTLISRDRVIYSAHLTVDVFEVIAQQLAKLILIEDNTQSAVSVTISYFLWTLAKYISTKYLVGIFLIGAFTLPRLYLQHQETINSHVAILCEKGCILARQYGGVASNKVQQLYNQVWTSLKKQPKMQKAK